MPKPADIGGKRLISLAPNPWVQWVTQSTEVVAREILNSEFQWISRQNDVWLKAFSIEHGEFLILNELQLRYSTKMPRRIRAYAALAEEKYNLPILAVLVNILPPSASVEILDRFESNFFGLIARQDFRVINLWEVDASIVFDRSIASLLPFVPILKGGGEPEIIEQAVQLLRLDDSLSELEPLLGFFASFVLDTDLVRQILRWDMAVLRESPWYQEIEDKGVLKGEQALIFRLLARRVGTISPKTQSQIQSLSLPQIEALGEALLDFSTPDDLTNWLEANQG